MSLQYPEDTTANPMSFLMKLCGMPLEAEGMARMVEQIRANAPFDDKKAEKVLTDVHLRSLWCRKLYRE